MVIVMAGVEVVAVNVVLEGDWSVANTIVHEESKGVAWQNTRQNKHTLLPFFFVVAMCRHNRLEAATIVAITARR